MQGNPSHPDTVLNGTAELDDEKPQQSNARVDSPVQLFSLRGYQHRAIQDLRAKVREGNRSVILVLPTGGGKTVIAQTIVKQHIERGGRVLFLAHRAELIRQSAETFYAGGIQNIRVIQASRADGNIDAPITVASIPTLAGKRWVDNLPPATLVIFDEAHHTRARSWERIASAYSNSTLVGLTATPERADGRALGDIFTGIVVCSTVRELTDLGYLVPCSVFAPREFRPELAADPADAYVDHGGGKKAIIFCASVEHARKVADDLNARGVPSACVDGKISAGTRRAYLDRFASGDLRVVTNCNVLTEGFNDPSAEVCILARACDHVGLYLQIVGRVLRPSPGKQSALLIDLRGTVHRHGLPDDPREYSLDGMPIRNTANELTPLKQCKRCGYCGRVWGKCPSCGHEQSNPKPPSVRREELKQIFAAHSDDTKTKYWKQLQSIAAERGYHRMWCHHRFVARYGHAFGVGRDAA